MKWIILRLIKIEKNISNHIKDNLFVNIMLSYNAKNTLKKQFPKFQFPYEKILHKKINTKNIIYFTIPKGKKYYVWFKKYGRYNHCYLLELERNRIKDIKKMKASFSEKLTIGRGTIMYGTLVLINGFPIFNIEDIHYFKGSFIGDKCLDKRIEYYSDIFNYVSQKTYNKQMLGFGLPIISDNYKTIEKQIIDLPYELYSIQYRNKYRNLPFLNKRLTIKQDKYKCFLVKSSHLPDIYELFYYKNGKLEYENMACITSYKQSVFMNTIFRNIKENDCLDALEESDDDEEFENIDEEKYLKKIYVIMKCKYNEKYKSWEPLEKINLIGDVENLTSNEKNLINGVYICQA